MSAGALIVILIIFFLIQGGVYFIFFRRQQVGGSRQEGSSEGMMLLQNQMKALQESMDERLGKSHEEMSRSLQHQLTESKQLIRDITKEISEVKETNKQVFSITESLQNLEKVLKSQKQRGNLGEAGLKLILENILPPGSYDMQYAFKSGEVVDAAIHAKDGIIPVDAKFSLENYNRILEEEDEARKGELEKAFKTDLKKRIDETAKYVRPEEGTLPFAIMYIPAEGIYYDLLVNQVGAIKVNTRSLIEYAYKEKKVIIVSPTTFVAYLQTILQGFRAFQIEKSAEEIGKRVEDLRRHLKAYEEFHGKLGNTLGTAVNHYNRSTKELGKIDKDIFRITGAGAELEVDLIEKPNQQVES